MKPENQVNMAPQRNHQRIFGRRMGLTFPLTAASISFWNWTLTRLKK